MEYDAFVTAPEPSNPWTSDDPSLWDLEARYKNHKLHCFFLFCFFFNSLFLFG